MKILQLLNCKSNLFFHIYGQWLQKSHVDILDTSWLQGAHDNFTIDNIR